MAKMMSMKEPWAHHP